MRYLFSVIIVSLFLFGCGRKGPLIPPEALVPAPVNDLAVTQRGESFLVSWSIPDKDGGGRPVRDVSYFRLFKREVLPPDEDCEACTDAYRVFKEVYLDYLRDARRVGNRLFISDAAVTTGVTYQYKVTSYLKDGTPSPDSNRFRLKKIAPFPAPFLKAISTPTSIVLHWEEKEMTGDAKARGYNIYRWRANDPPAIVPLNDTPIQASDFEDFRLERGVSYVYALRGVAEADGRQVESAFSNEVKGALTEPD
jgi:predicted small lipoprotein YifL